MTEQAVSIASWRLGQSTVGIVPCWLTVSVGCNVLQGSKGAPPEPYGISRFQKGLSHPARGCHN